MLPTAPDPIRIALNRLTFGARDLDVALVNQTGLAAWLADQFAAPFGDDPDLAAHLSTVTMHAKYPAPDASMPNGTWAAVDEDRPLSYIDADIPTLWDVARNAGTKYSYIERAYIRQQLLVASWIRNAHSKYQLREFMTDFWHNHFNIGKVENEYATDLLPSFDRDTIRPNVFGNFRTLLEATAMSPSMLLYLDNASSQASTPNENYAREIMELHTLGGAAYLGVTPGANGGGFGVNADGVLMGFSDQDVVQASRALSGWTIQQGQRDALRNVLPSNGVFIYNAAQHNTKATTVLGIDISGLHEDMAQGRKFIEIIAGHPDTAQFIVNKLCVRIFGDAPPAAAVSRGIDAWIGYKNDPKQIQRVLEAIVLGGSDISTAPVAKVRRPYERLMALARTTDMVLNFSPYMPTALDSLNDGLFAWQAPNGRPDVNSYWLATGAMLSTWNLLFQFPTWTGTVTSLGDQTPLDALSSANGVVEYWVNRMIGFAPSSATMTALVTDQAGSNGVPRISKSKNPLWTEIACRRLASLIATTEEFSYR